MVRFHPQWLRTREMVQSGALGDLRTVQVWFSYFNRNATNIRNDASKGGGALMDIGCKAKSYTGTVVSERYGKDSKGRETTVNVFKREIIVTKEQQDQSATLRLAAMLPGAVAGGMDALRGGNIVTFDSVAADVGHGLRGSELPAYIISRDAALKMFEKDGLASLQNSGHIRTIRASPFLAIYPPGGHVRQELVIPWAVVPPVQQAQTAASRPRG